MAASFEVYSPEDKKRLREEGLQEISPYVDKFIKDLTKGSNVRKFVRLCLEAAPLYFWRIPASSTGKYHPEWANLEGGLLHHTIFGAYMATEFAGTFGLTDAQTDIAVAAMFIHDTCKYGMNDEPELCYHDAHPILPRILYADPRGHNHQFHKELPLAVSDTIFDAISRHMGSIAKGTWINLASEGRLKPENSVEYVVHLADYVASRSEVYYKDFL